MSVAPNLRRGSGYTIAPASELERVCSGRVFLCGEGMALGRRYRIAFRFEPKDIERFTGTYIGPRSMLTSSEVGYAFNDGKRLRVLSKDALVSCQSQGAASEEVR